MYSFGRRDTEEEEEVVENPRAQRVDCYAGIFCRRQPRGVRGVWLRASAVRVVNPFSVCVYFSLCVWLEPAIQWCMLWVVCGACGRGGPQLIMLLRDGIVYC